MGILAYPNPRVHASPYHHQTPTMSLGRCLATFLTFLNSGNGQAWRVLRGAVPGIWPAYLKAWSAWRRACQDGQQPPPHPAADKRKRISQVKFWIKVSLHWDKTRWLVTGFNHSNHIYPTKQKINMLCCSQAVGSKSQEECQNWPQCRAQTESNGAVKTRPSRQGWTWGF